ncbi:MAG: hypothetical protein Q9212_006285 [Teloschistes hypoglaucus]
MDGVKEEASFTQSDYVLEESGNDWDRRGMARIGKKQELRREFHFFSITGYAMILGCSWEFALIHGGDGKYSAYSITALINLGDESYEPSQWQTALLSWAILLLAIFANTALFRKLPIIEGFVTFIHIFGFLAFVIVLWVMAPRATASSVFTEFESNGWSTTGLACLVGLNGPLPYLLGADSSVHLAEELKDSAWGLPRSMLLTAITNYITSFIVVGHSLVMAASHVVLGYRKYDPGWACKSSARFPEVLQLIDVNSQPGQCDGGLYGVYHMSHRHCHWKRSGLWDLRLLECLGSAHELYNLHCLYIPAASRIPFLNPKAYVVQGILHKRLGGEPLPASRFNLGRAGNTINIIALCFLAVFWVFQFFPAAPIPAPSDMNWSCVIWTGVLVFFVTYYAFWGRHNYVGPIAYVKSDV